MADLTLFVGSDVRKKTISEAMVEAAAGAAVRFCGTIAHTPLHHPGVGPPQADAGWVAAAFLLSSRTLRLWRASAANVLGHRCEAVAPAPIPRKLGGRVKADRRHALMLAQTPRDAMMLGQTLRAGQLTAVWVPDEAHEAMRDLVRRRPQSMRDLRKSRQQRLSFLLRHGRNSPGSWAPIDATDSKL
jgi:transposase